MINSGMSAFLNAGSASKKGVVRAVATGRRSDGEFVIVLGEDVVVKAEGCLVFLITLDKGTTASRLHTSRDGLIG
ncbi:hypothetical protein K443DRAFT_675218 [Laccaria amethystina LaAM-08-1]|uniref:Uncharacterized protein n=1 Tax=Laccaria amethystina LaAM-08-1 TaxID=1095629 RepID=A0A0C9XJN7_9AGAR|nr:hypothetical protein K443DRAFT_675218 [Laccaria amethystina LaAM-08-1]